MKTQQQAMNLITSVSNLAEKVSSEVLMPNFSKVKVDVKNDGSWVTIADQMAHQMLINVLPKLADYPVLSEELSSEQQQQIISEGNSSYWCVDPLDGTSNFTQGIPYWCISIALIVEGKIKLGVIYDPNRKECFAATDVSKTTLNGNELEGEQIDRLDPDLDQISDLKSAMGLIDFKRLNSSTVYKIASNPPYRSQRSFGAGALDFCWIAANRCQIYLHGKQKLWDYAAGVLILQQAQGGAETFSGEALFQNNLLPKSVIAATNKVLMKQWKNYFYSIQSGYDEVT